MPYLSRSELLLLSFPDTEILDFQVNLNEKICKISCIDGLLGQSPSGTILNTVTIEITKFHSLMITEYIENYIPVDGFNQEVALKDICEFILKENSVTLKGFSKVRGFWTEFVFEGGCLEVAFESESKMGNKVNLR